MKPAIFLDRDGTINVDYNYVHAIDKFDFIDGVIEAMQELKKMGFLLVITTNQSGIARNIFTEEQFNTLTEWMDWSLQDRGVDLDGIYYCPHDPLIDKCECRKPSPGMIQTAAKELNIDIASSYMVGDRVSDLLSGKKAGVKKTVLVKTGDAITEEALAQADWVIDSLADLPSKIRSQL
ncbi:D-glycero-beta-D-manno-heptose 1,7-bisphosphate 7-phosphatase [Gilliamella sp. B2838]|uniref:D-glycero-beta-D-manno-heptose 1,7-bisphosphate 7-phosphatase n=1 Tax=Gilliamella sp. B2838 TaxID=2818020 RepID=UPI00226A35BE|nr:D-glycero-beta-D-manno-heptose 1,7-bisphosphate 7-phosphatase [Gilliamella sp. B2838]MCX8728573.1 D-glycero-beta-D-manno-heptose 1,7-bisphosphate 7-phosphatase [Gilliamella sp. B2838]